MMLCTGPECQTTAGCKCGYMARMSGAAVVDWSAMKTMTIGGNVPKLEKRPVAFRVEDPDDGWILFKSEDDANRYADARELTIQGLYVRDGT